MALNIVSGNRYILVNSKIQTIVMDLSNEDSTSVIGWPRHGCEKQQWEITFTTHGWYIKNVWNGKFLRPEGRENGEDGQKLVTTYDPFIWHIWPDTKEPTPGRISIPNTSFVVDLSGFGNSAPGTPVELWGRHEPYVNQVWFFEKV